MSRRRSAKAVIVLPACSAAALGGRQAVQRLQGPEQGGHGARLGDPVAQLHDRGGLLVRSVTSTINAKYHQRKLTPAPQAATGS